MIHHWISALRPRTLLLALATCIIGNAIARANGQFSYLIMVLSIVLAISLQVLSNLANDLGDSLKGADSLSCRVGPPRMVQSGLIKASAMKTAMAITTVIIIISGAWISYEAIMQFNLTFILLLIIGLISIIAAITYTLGKKPYGYYAMGDLAAFFFFGPVAIIGLYFLQTKVINFQPVLPAIGIGLLSAAILNINNMRDIDGDRAVGKRTLASMLGLVKARLYQVALVLISQLCFIVYSIVYNPMCFHAPYFILLYVIVFIHQYLILKGIFGARDKHVFNKYLGQTAGSTFYVALAFWACSYSQITS